MKKFFNFISRTDIFCYLLIWLIFLLISGTISQKTLGLYAAQQKYFSSFFLWIYNIIPLPGGYITIGCIFFSLLARLAIYQWNFKNSGTIIIHLGALLLLFGGFMTSLFSKEGSMVIPEGETINYISDYHIRELVITKKTRTKEHQILFNTALLKKDNILASELLPFTIRVKEFYKNTYITKKTSSSNNQDKKPLTEILAFKKAPLFKDDEQNITSVILEIHHNKPSKINELYYIFEFMPTPKNITINNHNDTEKYSIELRKKRSSLPFSIKLIDFQKTSYPGTDIAKNYQSSIILKDNTIKWPGIIKMNHPLRYKGYTFFQTSFIENPPIQATILTVVKNNGRLFPYISSILICIGLLVHLIQRAFFK